MSSKFTCRFCKEQFDLPKGLYKHLQSVHTAGPSRDNRTCPICGVLCLKYEGYRDHLLYIHGQTDEGLKLTFKSLNEFLVWKAELELKHNCKYVLQSSPKVLPSKEKKYFYQCDRSGSKEKKDKKSMSVVMKTCSSVISVVEGTNIFKVEYWDTHSGHSHTASTTSLQNELEAAISSVEMVNAIAESDDSYDRSEDMLESGNSSPSVSKVEKPSFTMKANSPSNTNNFSNSSSVKKTDTTKPSIKAGVSKKNNPNTVLFSLASVACGKGISKKPPTKKDENKNNLKNGSENSQSMVEQVGENPVSVSELQKNNSVSQISVTVAPIKSSPVLASTTVKTMSTSLPITTKSSGLPAIAPKITSASTTISSASYATINSLISTNSAFPNQLVIVNPVGVDQNSLTSKQNVLTTGQNILLSLGTPGQNIVPAVSQPINVVSAGDKNAPIVTSSKGAKVDTPKVTSIVSQNISKSTVTSTASGTVPVTVKSGLNNAPVVLSSLPIGSTFMSVNNSLIPIATPSGTFLPTSLPPNIVLTPIVSGTSVSGSNSTQKTINSAPATNVVYTTMPSIQPQVRLTPSSTVAITVSSIVKEPVYSSSAVKQMSHIVASSTMPISSTSSLKTYSKIQNRSIPTTITGRISPLKNITKFMTSTPLKSNSAANSGSGSVVNKNASAFMNKFAGNVPLSKGNSFLSNSKVLPTVTVSSVSSPKNRTSARKRITAIKSKPSKSSMSDLSITSVSSLGNTKVVNSQLNLAPISSTTEKSKPMDTQDSETLIFESSGDVYMLEPVASTVSAKHMCGLETSKQKIDRSVQTTENCIKPKNQRKRTAAMNEDSAVMLKVKCYQLEMKYLNILGECKRLKVELTKERLKNAELTGEKAPDVTEEDMPPDTSRSKASEIMKEIEESFTENSDGNIYTMTKTSVLRSLYEDLEDLCMENTELNKELENYRAHDKFYKSLKKKIYDEEF